MVLFGYETGSAAYRVYDPATDRVHVSRDIVFDEVASWSWNAPLVADRRHGEAENFVVEHLCPRVKE